MNTPTFTQASINISDMAQTWNAGATTFTAIKMNVTDTASAAGSALMDLQLAGTTVLRLQKNGLLQFGGTTASFPALARVGTSIHVRLADDSALGSITTSGLGAAFINLGNAGDTILVRGGAGVMEQRNSTNPQAFRVYNTFTDGSNYERGFFRYASNALEIGHEGLGTGAVTPRTVSLWANGTRYFMVGGDIGAWNINTNSHLVCGLDNTRDIGTPGANRPRNVFVGNRVEASGDVIAGGTSDIQLSGRFRLRSAGDGIIALYNNAATNFNHLQFGGTSNAFPSIKRSGTGIDFRLADDSAFTGIGAASVSVDASTTARPHFALTAGVAPTSPANGDIWFDGTDMKIRIGGVTKTFTII